MSCDFVSSFVRLCTEDFGVPASSRFSGMEEARSSGSGKENPSTQSSNWTSYKATEENRWNCQIETEADTLGTWALRWEAAEAKSMRECISFTYYSLTNLTIPSARVTEDCSVRCFKIFSKRLIKTNSTE